MFAFLPVPVFKLLSRKVFLQIENTTETVKKYATFYENSKFHGKIMYTWHAKFSGYF